MTDSAPPILCIFENGVFRPARQSAVLRAQNHYEEGKTYALVEHHARSSTSHNHFFAVLEETYKNLPEIWAQEFASSEHLRKYALIKTGFYDCDMITCPDCETAEKVAAFARKTDEFAIVNIEGSVVRRFTAKSMRLSKMDRADLQRFKTAAFDLFASMLGTDSQTLQSNAGKAA